MNNFQLSNVNNNNNNNNVQIADSSANQAKSQLVEYAKRLIEENRELRAKREMDNCFEVNPSNKKQKIEDSNNNSQIQTISDLFPYLKDKPHYSETCTFLFYEKGKTTPFKFILPLEAVINGSEKFATLFKNTAGEIFKEPIAINNPVQGPFYSIESVGQLLSFIFTLSRQYREDLKYSFSQCSENVLVDLLNLIDFYQITDKNLENECSLFIFNHILKDQTIVSKYFQLVFSHPFEECQNRWAEAVLARKDSLEDNEKLCNELLDLLEKGLIINKNKNSSSILKVLFAFSQQFSSKPDVSDDFLERLYKNIVHLIMDVPQFWYSEDLNIVMKKELKTPFATILSCIALTIEKNPDLATQKLNDLLSQDPSNLYALTIRARINLNNKAQSLADLNQALENYPENCLALVERAYLYSHHQKYEESLRDIETALKLCPDLFYLYFKKAEILKKFFDHKKAEDNFKLCLEKLQMRQGFEYFEAMVYFKLDNLVEAYRKIDNYIKNPNYKRFKKSAYLLLGQIQLSWKEVQCFESFQKVREMDTKNQKSAYAIAKLLCHSELFLQEALDVLQESKSNSLIPSVAILALEGEIFLRLGKLNKAWDQLVQSFQLKSQDSRTLTLMAEVQMRLNKMSYALKQVEDALKLNPKDDDALSIKGELLFRKGQIAEASDCLNRSLYFNPKNSHALMLLGELSLQSDQYDEAIKFLTASLKQKEKAQTRFLMAKTYFKKNELNDARSEINLANIYIAQSEQKSASAQLKGEIFRLMGEIFWKLGDRETAKRAFDQAIENDAEDVQAFFLRGEIQRELGKNNEAIADYTTAILFQNHREALRQRAILYWQQGNQKLALEDAQHLLEKDPGSDIMHILTSDK